MATQAYDLPDRYADQDVKFAGFGYYDSSETTSDDLRETNFKILSESTCLARSLYYKRSKAKNAFFCAGNLNGRTSTCSGDSGGPLVKETLSATNDYFFKLVGVLHGSKNSNCAIRRPTSHPSMFSNLEHQKNFDFISQWKDSYNDFINAVTDQNHFTQ
eukprot:01722.XXX_6882_7420_1 [CDS] Oithona nana genome sequencing.